MGTHRFWRGAAGAVAIAAATLAACTSPTPTPGWTGGVPAPGGGGIVGVNPEVVSTPGAQTKVVSYGPFTVPAAIGTQPEQEGMLRNGLKFGIGMPCTDCYITSMQAGLRLADGRVGDVDTGQMLHHIVLAASPRSDTTCGTTLLAFLGERFFASGDERTRARFPAGYGYPVRPGETWNMMYELMNETLEPSVVSVEMTFEWVPRTTAGMKALRPVWLDVGTCLASAVPAQTGSYSYTSNWTATVAGPIIGIGGHLHDGGTHLALTDATSGQPICTMAAGYGGPAAPAGGADDHGDHGDGGGHAGMHLSSMTQCLAPDAGHPVGTLTRGQKVKTVAYYDTAAHPEHGNHPVMGISIVFVGAR
jgi:hypothetical protein